MKIDKKNRAPIFIFIFIALLILTTISFYFFNVAKGRKDDIVDQITSIGKPKIVSCTRTTRLDNEPQYDRALSIIGERYHGWDDAFLSGKSSFSSFPSQLVNCIKVIESDVKSTTGAEGEFIFNSSEIKDNYFPVTVDKNYSYTDDYINALLLVHEITHVEQYIKSINKTGEQLSCIDKEVEAFYAEWKLPTILGNEAWKSIHYRIDYDKDLNPQLQILSTISDNYHPEDVKCVQDSDTSKCIEGFQKNVIKKIILQDDFYKKECGL